MPSLANQTGTNNKVVKLTDIAIGDFIVAMGYVNQNSVLSAQRILVTDPTTEPKIDISMEKVNTVSKKTLSVIDVNNNHHYIYNQHLVLSIMLLHPIL